jgi:S1-C subfamily serine protease
MKKKIFILFLFTIISNLIYGQNYRLLHKSTKKLLHTTTNPNVQESALKAEIISVIIFEQLTVVRIRFTSRGKKVNFRVPSSTYIADVHNANNKFLIRNFENHKLDEAYNIGPKNRKSPFNLIFPRIAPGIELINIKIPSSLSAWGYTWKGVKIKNPDNHPKTSWNENKLKTHWLADGFDPLEGIYENTSVTETSTKYTLALKKEANGYNLIYLSGADHLTWKVGDLKASLSETGKSNLFKVKWYMSNKVPNENLFISFESGFMKIVWSNTNGTKSIQQYLKLYPTAKSSKTISSVSSGTGFALSSDGFIVTNQHIINNKKIIRIRGVNGDFSRTYNAKVILEDKKNNVAILKIETANFKGFDIVPYTFKKLKLALGEEVYCLGYSEGAKKGDEIKLTRSMISSNTGFKGDITTNQINTLVELGNSGGPLLNLQGEIVGIIDTKLSNGKNASCTIKINYLMNLIHMVDPEIKLPNLNLISSENFPSQVQQVKEFVYIIETN